MLAQIDAVILHTLDGLRSAGTLVASDQPPERAVVLVHGGGVTREEGGFFARLAADSLALAWPACGSTCAATARARAAGRS